MGEYLVELYTPGTDRDLWLRAAARARSGAELLGERGVPVRYLRSIFIPGDETCFHVFDGPSLEAVRAAAERASAFERIVAIVQIEPRQLRGGATHGEGGSSRIGRGGGSGG